MRKKVSLRLAVLDEIQEPVVLETHGGYGSIWRECYPNIGRGIVFETDPAKAAHLALQRPDWSVYQVDVIKALRDGAGDHRTINLLDVDPYGSPWPILEAFFASDRPWADCLHVVVNDGLKRLLQRNGSGRGIDDLEEARHKYGPHLWDNYLQVCRDLMQKKAALAGYRLSRWGGYYTGRQGAMTHYRAVLTRE